MSDLDLHSRHTSWQSTIRHSFQNYLSVFLILSITALLAWFSTRYEVNHDWTYAGRHSLSESSRQVLETLQEPLEITAFASDKKELRLRISTLVQRYQQAKEDIHLSFINPDTAPNLVREQGISVDGELLLRYAGKTEHLRSYSEQSFTNALHRLSRSKDQWVAFLQGHGERNPFGKANHDVGLWAANLASRGLKVQSVNLSKAKQIPDNTTVLVIANPLVRLLPGEVDAIKTYIESGGNLLWMLEPDSLMNLGPLAELFGIKQIPGTIADPSTLAYGINHPTFSIITRYAAHPATREFNYLTVFPEASGLYLDPVDGWQATALFQTDEKAWSEGDKLEGDITPTGDNDIQGPLTIAYALSRDRENQPQQRIVITGDGDFLADPYLGNSGNMDLGYRLVNWLVSDDQLIEIPTRTANDVDLNLSQTAAMFIGSGFLLALPLILFITGLRVWLRRRKF